MSLQFLIIFGVLQLLVLVGYYFIAKRYNIVDKPNERSSHDALTIRGGGILFPLSVLMWGIAASFQGNTLYLILAVSLTALVSFIDDRYTISVIPRLISHIIAILLLFISFGWLGELNNVYLFGVLVVCIGWVNVFNFMDGINGISTLYALAILIPLNALNTSLESPTVPYSLFWVIFSSLFIFGFTNVRKKALMFAGDVGSISLALILIYLMIKIAWEHLAWSMFALLLVYGIDSVMTILSRLLKKENIFKAHRSHLYQYLANEKGIEHVKVSLLYMALQLIISFTVICAEESQRSVFFGIWTLLLIGVYIPVKKWAKN